MFTSKQKVPDYTPPEIEPGDINSYITNRLDDQINWYDKNLRMHKSAISACN